MSDSFFNLLKSIVSKSETFDRIIIIGKGQSANEIDYRSYQNAFVICLNDAERIHRGNLCLYHQKWVLSSLIENGLSSEYYISGFDNVKNNDERFVGVDYENVTFDSLERFISDFSSRNFVLTDFLVLSAIKIAGLISQVCNKKLKTFLIGFDFHASTIKQSIDLSGHELTYKNALFATQKAYLSYVKDFINEIGTLQLIHVGSLDISDLSVNSYNSKYVVEPIGVGKNFDFQTAYLELIEKVQDQGYVLVVAEFTNNHLGDADRIKRMVALAKQSGADMIKVQKRNVETFYSKDELSSPYKSPFGNTLKEYRMGVELGDELFEVLIEECIKHEIVWFASILDYPSLEYIERFDPILIKLPSTISNHKQYLRKVAKTYNGDLVISTGFTDKSYERFVLDTFLPGRNLFLLQCTSSYPAPPEACQLGVVRHYDHISENVENHGLIPGYSSHDVGSLGCMMAVSAGALMVEKHVKLGNIDWIHFDSVALDLLDNEFSGFVSDVRKASAMTGSKEKRIHHQEHHKYHVNQMRSTKVAL